MQLVTTVFGCIQVLQDPSVHDPEAASLGFDSQKTKDVGGIVNLGKTLSTVHCNPFDDITLIHREKAQATSSF